MINFITITQLFPSNCFFINNIIEYIYNCFIKRRIYWKSIVSSMEQKFLKILIMIYNYDLRMMNKSWNNNNAQKMCKNNFKILFEKIILEI